MALTLAIHSLRGWEVFSTLEALTHGWAGEPGASARLARGGLDLGVATF